MSVLTEVDGPVLVVKIDRPHRRNAVDRYTAEALLGAFEMFDAHDKLSVAILAGTDGNFCAGADLKAISDGNGNRVATDGPGPMGPTRLLMGKPVIAAIEGFAVAGGLELALWCDLRVMARNAVMGVFCRRWGVPLVDGGTVRLPRLIGSSRAADMILTGRGVSGNEALEFGLANRLTEPGAALEGALEMAHQLASLPQKCLRSDLRSSKDQWDLPFGDAMVREYELGTATIRSGETIEGAIRFASGVGRHGVAADQEADGGAR